MEENKKIPNGKKIPTNKKISNKKRVVVYKQSNQSGIIIGFLLAVVLGLICYICYDKGILFNNQPTENNNEITENGQTTQKEESVTFTDSQLEKYVNYISPVSFGPSALIYNTASVNAATLSAAEKIQYIGNHVSSKHTSSANHQYSMISEIDVKNAVEEVYGPNTYARTTFNLGCGDYKFNETDKKYYAQTGCGGTTPRVASNVIIGYNATKTKLEITTAYVFLDGMTGKLYKNYDMTVELGNYTGSVTDDMESNLRNYIKNNKEKLNTIVYTFESSNGSNYYFTGFKNNK